MHCCKVCIGYCQKCAYKYSGEYIATHKIVFHRIVHWAVKRWEATSILAPNAIYYNVHLLHCTLGTLGSTMNQCSAPKLPVHKQHIVHCTLGTWAHCAHWAHWAHWASQRRHLYRPLVQPGARRGGKTLHSLLHSSSAVFSNAKQCDVTQGNTMQRF